MMYSNRSVVGTGKKSDFKCQAGNGLGMLNELHYLAVKYSEKAKPYQPYKKALEQPEPFLLLLCSLI